MYNVNLYSNNHTFGSSFHKQFYSPTKNQLTQYQKNFISQYQDQNRINNNSFYSTAQSPYIFQIPKNRINNFLQRTPSPPPYNRFVYNYKENFNKLLYNQSPQNLKKLNRQISPMNLMPRPASPDPLNSTTNNNIVSTLFQNPITSININKEMHRYKTPEPRRNNFNNSLNVSNSNISDLQKNANNLNHVNNIRNISQYNNVNNNSQINLGNQSNISNNTNQNNIKIIKKISKNSIRNSFDSSNNSNYQMPYMNNNLNPTNYVNNKKENYNPQNKNFQNISVDKNSSISNNNGTSANNIQVINPGNINQIESKYNFSNILPINYNHSQNANISQIQRNNNFSGKNIPNINNLLKYGISPQQINQKHNNYNFSKKSNQAINISPIHSQNNFDPNLNNIPFPYINNINVINQNRILNVKEEVNYIIPIPKQILKNKVDFLRRNLKNIVISKPVPNDNFNPLEFNILKQIGEGSFGKIYCVKWIKNGELYAMKKLNLFGEEELNILQNKVKIVQNLQKKTGINGFTTIYGDKCIPVARPNEYHYYIIMELVEKDWEVELKRRRVNLEFYTEYELLNITKQLVKTLSIMQKNNVTHRDIKPQNILIKEGLYKLCDFDEVKMVYNPQPCMHSVRGSELYMSPILFYAYQNKTPSIVHNTYKSDVFSLGMCILLAAGLTAKTLCDIREIKDMNVITEIIISRLFNRYSQNFIQLIIKMLQLEEILRFDFIELEEYILSIWPN